MLVPVVGVAAAKEESYVVAEVGNWTESVTGFVTVGLEAVAAIAEGVAVGWDCPTCVVDCSSASKVVAGSIEVDCAFVAATDVICIG